MVRSSKKSIKPEDQFLFKSAPRSTRLGKKQDLSRFVKWPKYVRLQRQRKILKQRLKVPPQINQFNCPANKNLATKIFELAQNYKPETKKEKQARLEAEAKAEAASGSPAAKTKPAVLKFGLNHVTTLIEQKKARLVLIATDVDPIELVVWLPALCRLQGVAYAIVKSKSRLGTLVHQKNATCVAITKVEQKHEHILANLEEECKSQFNNNVDVQRKWGGGIMGLKTQRRLEKREAVLKAERAKQAKIMS